ncbi:transposase [Streptomyces sp. GQFP]|uniref:transposase n=1 Tax=Streptomyces sp. GQFP TaxID=2907545 RepID=UPI001F3C2366|nr:transposase [Streptomyces sp. GQFP]UIX31344.1 transposase [Streptomyces sp. GQFP]
MKLVVQVKLLPTPVQAAALEATPRACNRAADHVAQVGFKRGVKDRNGLQKLLYAEVKARFGLSAQPAVRVVKKVADACTARTAQAKAGRPGIDPAYTSQRCPRCGHTEWANRSDRDHFRCRRCGLVDPADHVAGVNARNRAHSVWAFVNRPV